MSAREFPVLNACDARKRGTFPKSVPWAFVAPHEAQALRNHGQTLQRLAERGGLSAAEMLAVVTGRTWWEMGKPSDIDAAPKLLALLAAFGEPAASERAGRECAICGCEVVGCVQAYIPAPVDAVGVLCDDCGAK